MEFDEFIELIKEPEGREYIAKVMCEHTQLVKPDKTLEAIRYLSLPILLMFDKEIKE